MNSIYAEIKALNKSDLLPRSKSLYIALMEIADGNAKCKTILASLVFKSGISESSVIRATKELEAAGFISVIRFSKRGPLTPPNIYTLIHRTKQSCEPDSSSPVKLKGKNTSNNNKDKSITSTTNTNACHHDIRGEAPYVMSDRLVIYEEMLRILKEHEKYFNAETEFKAHDVVDLIGLDGLESELQKRRSPRTANGEYQPSVLEDLSDIFQEEQMAARLLKEKEDSCTEH